MSGREGILPKVARTWALAALSGGLLSLAFPRHRGAMLARLRGPGAVLVAIEEATWRQAGLLGFVAGLVFWLATIPWVAATMVRYGGLPWPLASLILLSLVGYLALYWAFFCAPLARCPLRSGALDNVWETHTCPR
jgi:apolipoprotein N-acyltransferase